MQKSSSKGRHETGRASKCTNKNALQLNISIQMYSANVAAGSLSADKAKGLASAANKDGLLELQRWLGGSEASGREVVTIVTDSTCRKHAHAHEDAEIFTKMLYSGMPLQFWPRCQGLGSERRINSGLETEPLQKCEQATFHQTSENVQKQHRSELPYTTFSRKALIGQ